MAAAAASPVRLLRAARTTDAPLRLLCFPHAGGGSATYRRWARILDGDVELWTCVLPGRGGDGSAPCSSWDGLVDEIVAELLRLDERPLVLLGHSFGGLVAFEVARRLDAHPEHPSPLGLAVSGCLPPDRLDPDRRVPADDGVLVDQIDRRYGALPAAIRNEPELLRMFLPTLRADLELAAAYVHRAGLPLSCPITCFGGRSDPAASPIELMGWATHTRAAFERQLFEGGHFFLHDDVVRVAEALRHRLLGLSDSRVA